VIIVEMEMIAIVAIVQMTATMVMVEAAWTVIVVEPMIGVGGPVWEKAETPAIVVAWDPATRGAAEINVAQIQETNAAITMTIDTVVGATVGIKVAGTAHDHIRAQE